LQYLDQKHADTLKKLREGVFNDEIAAVLEKSAEEVISKMSL